MNPTFKTVMINCECVCVCMCMWRNKVTHVHKLFQLNLIDFNDLFEKYSDSVHLTTPYMFDPFSEKIHFF